MATVFQIIAVVVIIVSIIVLAVILPILSRLLKGANRSFASIARGVREQVSTSLSDIDVAQDQLDVLLEATSAVRSGLDAAKKQADRAVAALNSNVFQVAVPVALWLIFLLIAIPRGMRLPKRRKEREAEPIPPPSWQEGAV